MTPADPGYLWTLYRDTQQRIVDLMSDSTWDTGLPACPLWTVRDIVAHMTAVAEDWVRGGPLTAPPTDAETAAQIARFSDHDTAVWQASDQLLDFLRTPVPVCVQVEDGEYLTGPASGLEIELHTSRFEALRWGTGRRSHAQLSAMDWSADPGPVLAYLYLFGPAHADLVE